MANKSVKSPLLSLGVISAISATGIFFGGIAANAQTNTTQPGQSTTQPGQLPSGTDQSPSQLNQTPSQSNQTPSQSNQTPSQLNQSPSLNSPNNSTSGTSTTSPLSTYSPNQAPILRVGSQGQAVRDIQAYLSQQGLYRNAADGVYGSQTRAAVRQFQQSRNLPVDGVVGPQTWGAMLGGSSGSSGTSDGQSQ